MEVAGNTTWALGNWVGTGAALGTPQLIKPRASAPSASAAGHRRSRKKPCTTNSPDNASWQTTFEARNSHRGPQSLGAARNARKFIIFIVSVVRVLGEISSLRARIREISSTYTCISIQ
jgi:hypothetical protein